MSDIRKIFGTDGVRGKANEPPMTVEMAMAIGQGVAATLVEHHSRPKITIGKDTRLSGYMFENALVAGIVSMGVDVHLVGPIPTPAIAFLTQDMRSSAGIVISASHNPFYDNGIKIFGPDGYKLPDAIEAEIESHAWAFLKANGNGITKPTDTGLGKAVRLEDATGRFIVFLKKAFPAGQTLDGIRIAVDCAHGATYKVGPAVLGELGARLKLLGVNPNGVNINDGVGSLHPQGIQELVKKGEADIGLAFDGDGDQPDHGGRKRRSGGRRPYHGHMRRPHAEPGHLGPGRAGGHGDVQPGFGNLHARAGHQAFAHQGGRPLCGEEAMRAGGYNLGGEQSGHLLYLDHSTTGDGILSALMVLTVMVSTGKPLCELRSIMTSTPQVLVNLRVKEKKTAFPSARPGLGHEAAGGETGPKRPHPGALFGHRASDAGDGGVPGPCLDAGSGPMNWSPWFRRNWELDMLFCIDIGNTHSVLGVFQGNDLVAHWRVHTNRDLTGDELGVLISQPFRPEPGSHGCALDGIIISSGVPTAQQHLCAPLPAQPAYGAAFRGARFGCGHAGSV